MLLARFAWCYTLLCGIAPDIPKKENVIAFKSHIRGHAGSLVPMLTA